MGSIHEWIRCIGVSSISHRCEFHQPNNPFQIRGTSEIWSSDSFNLPLLSHPSLEQKFFHSTDSGIFPPDAFKLFLQERTAEDGSDLGSKLGHLFQVLNTPPDKRGKNLDEDLAQFDYINGELFAEPLSFADFTSSMRSALIECAEFKWEKISPAIFGSLFQTIFDHADDRKRRQLPDTECHANFELTGLNVSDSLGYMGKIFPEAHHFIERFKKGDEKYHVAARELHAYTRGGTDVLDNLILTLKTFFPRKELTLEVLNGARSILAQPSLLLTHQGIEPDCQ